MSRVTPLVVSFVPKVVSFLTLCSLLVVCGCSALRVKLGARVSLDSIPVVSIKVALPNAPGIAPGEKSPLVATLTASDGTVLLTEGKGKGKVLWKDLTVTASVLTVNKKGIASLPSDPRVSEGKTGHVTIAIPSQPGVKAEMDIPVRYDYPYKAIFSGRTGFNGTNGTSGLDGTRGSAGSFDPNNLTAGGNGTDGSDGGNGTDGDKGGDGPSVQVRVTLREALQTGGHVLLQVSVAADGGGPQYYLLDPQGGSISVSSEGGSGGSGGRGGSGGHGGSGGIGSPNGSSGRDGASGHNGLDGSRGHGGSISVAYDPQAKPFLDVIHLSSQNGPAPVWNEEHLPQIW